MQEHLNSLRKIYTSIPDDSILKKIKKQTVGLHKLLKQNGENVRVNELNTSMRNTLSITNEKYQSFLKEQNIEEAEVLEKFMKTFYGFTKISKDKNDYDYDENKLKRISINLLLIYVYYDSLLRELIESGNDEKNSFFTQLNAHSIESKMYAYMNNYLIPTMVAHEYLEEILAN